MFISLGRDRGWGATNLPSNPVTLTRGFMAFLLNERSNRELIAERDSSLSALPDRASQVERLSLIIFGNWRNDSTAKASRSRLFCSRLWRSLGPKLTTTASRWERYGSLDSIAGAFHLRLCCCFIWNLC